MVFKMITIACIFAQAMASKPFLRWQGICFSVEFADFCVLVDVLCVFYYLIMSIWKYLLSMK